MDCCETSNWWTFAVEGVAAVLEGPAIEIGANRVVGGLGPTEVVCEALAKAGNPIQTARRRSLLGGELHFEVRVYVGLFEE